MRPPAPDKQSGEAPARAPSCSRSGSSTATPPRQGSRLRSWRVQHRRLPSSSAAASPPAVSYSSRPADACAPRSLNLTENERARPAGTRVAVRLWSRLNVTDLGLGEDWGARARCSAPRARLRVVAEQQPLRQALQRALLRRRRRRGLGVRHRAARLLARHRGLALQALLVQRRGLACARRVPALTPLGEAPALTPRAGPGRPRRGLPPARHWPACVPSPPSTSVVWTAPAHAQEALATTGLPPCDLSGWARG